MFCHVCVNYVLIGIYNLDLKITKSTPYPWDIHWEMEHSISMFYLKEEVPYAALRADLQVQYFQYFEENWPQY